MTCPAPLISIITVTYNAEATLRQTIESIRAQTFQDIEQIIVDGESRDKTLAIADEYQSSTLKIVSEKDRGLYDAMNKGLALARGEWIIFLNAGDYFHHNEILARVSQLMEGDNDIIYSDVICDYGGGVKKILEAPPEHKVLSTMKRKMCIYHNAVFIRTSLHKKYPYNLHYRIAADYDMLLRLVLSGARLKRVTDAIATIETGAGVSYLNPWPSMSERHQLILQNAPTLSGIVYNASMAMLVMFKSYIKRCLPQSIIRLIIKLK